MSDMDSGYDKARLTEILNTQKTAFLEDPYPSLEERKDILTRLHYAIVHHKQAIIEAISADYGHRSSHETLLLEVFTSIEAIKHAKRRLKTWMKPQKRHVSLWYLPGKARVFVQPLGVVGIIVPWNYPFYLAIGPLVGALAAGNRVMIKTSEFTPRMSRVLQQLMRDVCEPDRVAVVEGGPEVGVAFSQLPFNHLLFTGSTTIGRHVMHAASENLTPVTLELGGKSPTIIGPDYPLEHAVEKILMGKCLNAGQTCIAPDYVFVPKHHEQAFVEMAREQLKKRYPDYEHNPDYTNIITVQKCQRLKEMLTDAEYKGAKLVSAMETQQLTMKGQKLPLYLVLEPSNAMTVMKEEIFGPILPILSYESLDEVIRWVNARPRPLALYYFGKDKRDIERIITETHSGGVTVNDTLLHVAQDDMPFGGVGASGMGHYHAKEGFETFSKKKAIFYQSKLSPFRLLYPPYKGVMNTLLKWLIR